MLKFWAWGYSNPTEAEQALEPSIAALGKRYRFQHPFFKLKHLADFVLLDDKVVIEVDGKSHDKPEQQIKDLRHMLALEAMGYKILRCRNEDAIRNPKETVATLLADLKLGYTPLEASEVALEIDHLQSLLKPKKPRQKRRGSEKKKKDWQFPKRPPLPL